MRSTPSLLAYDATRVPLFLASLAAGYTLALGLG